MILKCVDQLLDLNSPKIMGILNTTPDSFYDGGKYTVLDKIKERVNIMVDEGVDIIDVGGMSSRPGAEIISPSEELSRVIPAIEYINSVFPRTLISIDTVHASTAKESLENGAKIVNDISGGNHDHSMISVVSEYQAAYILMHMNGLPKNMQDAPAYEDIVRNVLIFFINKLKGLNSQGVYDVVVDPGFGFGKTIDHNYELLKKLSVFKILECPILAGISRKSMIYKFLDISPDESLTGTAICNFMSLQQGAKILRVHDIKEANQTIKLFSKLEKPT